MIARTSFLRARAERSESARKAIDDKAIPVVERLLGVDPDGWAAPRYLADIALRRGAISRAIDMFKRLQRFCPADPASWRGLAGIYLSQGRDDLALPQLLELARFEEGDATVAARIARIYKRLGRIREAPYWYRRALHIAPFSVDLHKALGDTSMQLGDTAGALRAYRMLTQLEPERAAHFAAAAQAAHKLGDSEQAQSLARQAVGLDPTSPARSLLPPAKNP